VEQNEDIQGSVHFGAYLRRVREGRRLSLDAVEELSTGFPEKVTKSHLSRIENGLALPTFPRLMAMSHIYGVPIASLAERYEIELRRGMRPVELGGAADADVLSRIAALELEGRYDEVMVLASALIERRSDVAALDAGQRLEIDVVRAYMFLTNALVHLGRYEFAKTLTEQLMSVRDVPARERFLIQQQFIICCYRLRRFTVALMALQQAEGQHLTSEATPIDRAKLVLVKGNVEYSLGDFEGASATYEAALGMFTSAGATHDACRARINLASALAELKRFDEARDHLATAASEAEAGSLERLKALCYCSQAIVAFRQGEEQRAEDLALKSNAIARPREYHSLVVRNCYYLWRVARSRGDDQGMRAAERSIRTYSARTEEFILELEEFRNLSEREAS